MSGGMRYRHKVGIKQEEVNKMIDTISEYQFTDWFMENRPNNFSYEGTKALFDYLEQLEEDCGQPMEFDPIAFCCAYSQYDNLKECLKEYL